MSVPQDLVFNLHDTQPFFGFLAGPSAMENEGTEMKVEHSIQDEFRKRVQQVIESFGGPFQYLHAKYTNTDSFKALAEKILALAPKKTTVRYQCAGDAYSNDDVLLHLTDLGIHLRASSKGIPPYAHTAVKLAEEMITHGFSSEHDRMVIASVDVGDAASAFLGHMGQGYGTCMHSCCNLV